MENRFTRRRDTLVLVAVLVFCLFQFGLIYYRNLVKRQTRSTNATYEIAPDGVRTPVEPVVSADEKPNALPDAIRTANRILLIIGANLLALYIWVAFRLAFWSDSIRSLAFTFRFAWGVLAFGLLEIVVCAWLGFAFGFGHKSVAMSIFPLANCGAFLAFFGVILLQRAFNERDKRDERKLDTMKD